MSISKSELLKGRDIQYASEYTQEISDNLDKLLVPLNKIRDAYGKPMVVTSGWRPKAINGATLGAATHSKHMLGLAADIADPYRKLMDWVLENLQLMQDLGIYMENFKWTKGWVHFQCVPPSSGKRIFVPSSAPPSDPNCWDGKYDSKFND